MMRLVYPGLMPLLRILYGLLFVASAVLKLFPLEYFELILVDQLGVAWGMVPYFSRALVILEFTLGISLIFGCCLPWMLWGSVAMLIAFQSLLIWQMLSGISPDNCGCFGELIPMDGPASLTKNFLLIGMALWLILKLPQAMTWRMPWVIGVLLVIAVPALFILYPLPQFSTDADFELDVELLERVPFETVSTLSEGDKTVVVMLASCVHCAQLASLISTLEPTEVEDKLRIIVLGGEGGVEYFVTETGIGEFVFVRSEDRELVGAIGGLFPTVLQLKNGVVTKKWKGRDVNIALLTDLLDVD